MPKVDTHIVNIPTLSNALVLPALKNEALGALVPPKSDVSNVVEASTLSPRTWQKFIEDPKNRDLIIAELQKEILPQIERKILFEYQRFDKKQEVSQALLIGLNSLIDTYEPQKASFVWYVQTYLPLRVKDHWRSEGVLNRSQAAFLAKSEEVSATLTSQLSTPVRLEDSRVAQRMGIPYQDFLARHAVVKMLRPMSEGHLGSSNGGTPTASLAALASVGPEDRSPEVETRMLEMFVGVLTKLPERTMAIVQEYSLGRRTLKELGDVFGVTESRVWQIWETAKQTLKENYYQSLPIEVEQIARLLLSAQQPLDKVANAFGTSVAHVRRIQGRLLSGLAEREPNLHPIFRSRGEMMLVLAALERNPQLKIFEALRVLRYYAHLDAVRKDRLSLPICGILGAPMRVNKVAVALVRQGYLSAEVPQTHIRTRARLSHYFDPSVVGAQQARANLRQMLHSNYPTLDKLPANDIALYATLGLRSSGSLSKKGFAAECVRLGLMSKELPQGHKLGAGRGKVSLYFVPEVVGAEQVKLNVSKYLKSRCTSLSDFSDARLSVRALSRILNLPDDITTLIKYSLREGLFSADIPPGTRFSTERRPSPYFLPQIVGAKKAWQNLVAWIYENWHSLDDIRVSTPLSRYLKVGRSRAALAQFMVQRLGYSVEVPDGHKPPPRKTSVYTMPEVVGLSAAKNNRLVFAEQKKLRRRR